MMRRKLLTPFYFISPKSEIFSLLLTSKSLCEVGRYVSDKVLDYPSTLFLISLGDYFDKLPFMMEIKILN